MFFFGTRRLLLLGLPLGATFILRVRLVRHGVASRCLGATPEVCEFVEVPRLGRKT
jgi:hypothetical protein